ncbi:MAG: fibronectin type III domain-containing protein, partial [Actinomycetes bacterium]
SSTIQVAAGVTTANRDIALQRAGTISGTITGPGGTPLTPAQIGDLDVFALNSGGDDAFASINPDGSFSIGLGLLTGPTYTLTVVDGTAHFKNYTSAPFNVADGASVTGKNVSLQVAGAISGTLTGPGGTALTLDEINNLSIRADGAGGSHSYGSINPDGSYSIGLAVVTGPTYTLTASDDSGHFRTYTGAPFTVADGASVAGKNITLQVAGTITGTITGPGGTALTPTQISDLSIGATNANGSQWGSINPDGTFTIALTTLTGPTYTLVVTDDSGHFGTYTSAPFNVAEGASVAGKNITLQVAGTITGTITGPGGTALTLTQLNNLSIRANDTSGSRSYGSINPDGSYSIGVGTLVGPTYTVTVADDNGLFKTYTSAPFDVAAGSSVTGKNVTLQVAATISGTVTGPGGAALSVAQINNLDVKATNANGDQWGGMGADGTFTIALTTLTGPSYSLVVTDGSTHFQTYTSAPFTVADGASSPGHTIALSLTPSVPGTPAAPTAAAGNGQATIDWTAPTTIGSPIADYEIRYSSTGGAAWSTFTHPASAATHATVTGLANGTGYVFQIAAINATGKGAFSPSSATVTPQAPYNPPVVNPPGPQHVAGAVPASIKTKKNKKVALPKRTDAGVPIVWVSATPKVCKVAGGKLVLTGKKGACRITAKATADGTHTALRQLFAIRLK